jgi:2',3'-cyclic-nucleotide 2'-phosphodiesterase
MKILFIGDIFARPGRRAVRELLPGIVKEHGIDFIVANAENAAGGFGTTADIVEELFRYGCDVLTGGNHSWDKREFLPVLDDHERVLRPHNYPAENPGSGVAVVKCNGVSIAVLNLQGRIFMPPTDCPFKAADRLVESVKDEADIILVDLHAEATSEKQAMAWHLDGRVSALVGTHTHVQTADEQVFPQGMAYITDLGMTGPHRSVIGVKVEQSLGRFLNGRPSRFEAAKGDVRFHGAVVDIDEETGRARAIARIRRALK